MMHPYALWLLAMEQQEQIKAHASPTVGEDIVRRSAMDVVREKLGRSRRRSLLGHAVTNRRPSVGCAA